MKVLITVPRMNKAGGVTNYYKVVDKYLAVDKKFFEIGSFSSKESKASLLYRMLCDYIVFFKEILFNNYDVVHINPSLLMQSLIRESILIILCRIKRVPVVVFIHGWDKDCEYNIRRKYQRMFRYVYGKASAIIVLAEEFKSSLVDFGIESPVYILSTLVDDAIFERCLSKKDSHLSTFKILFLSRVEKEKGIYEAIDACSHLHDEYPGLILNVAGDGAEIGNVQDYIREHKLDYVKLLGLVQGEEKEDLFIQSDLYLFPTNYGEGMPTTVLEAMAYGLPVITRPVGGLKDFFEDGKMGFITDSLEPVDYANLMKRLLSDDELRRGVSEYNRAYAMNNFSASIVANKILGIYKNVCGKA